MASVVKFSEAEAQELAPVLGLHWKGPKDFTQELASSARLRGVAVTAGAAASSLLLDAQYSSQKPPGTAIVDTVGAGDAFAAGLLDAIAEGLPAAAALRHANALGALVASGQGAQPPWSPGEVTRLEEGLVVGAVSRGSMSEVRHAVVRR
jgi:fructokinase